MEHTIEICTELQDDLYEKKFNNIQEDFSGEVNRVLRFKITNELFFKLYGELYRELNRELNTNE